MQAVAAMISAHHLPVLGFLLAAGVCLPISWGCGPNMQCGSSGRKHWLLPVNVSAWVLHLPIRRGGHYNYLGDQYHSKVDHSSDSFVMVFMGICTIYCWFSVTSQKSLSCISIVAVVYLHGLASTDQVTHLEVYDRIPLLVRMQTLCDATLLCLKYLEGFQLPEHKMLQDVEFTTIGCLINMVAVDPALPCSIRVETKNLGEQVCLLELLQLIAACMDSAVNSNGTLRRACWTWATGANLLTGNQTLTSFLFRETFVNTITEMHSGYIMSSLAA